MLLAERWAMNRQRDVGIEVILEKRECGDGRYGEKNGIRKTKKWIDVGTNSLLT